MSNRAARRNRFLRILDEINESARKGYYALSDLGDLEEAVEAKLMEARVKTLSALTSQLAECLPQAESSTTTPWPCDRLRGFKTPKRQCRALTANGKQCRQSLIEGTLFCKAHATTKAPTLHEITQGLDKTLND